MENENAYERLAHGIILQAVKDYRKACGQLKRNFNNDVAYRQYISCKTFFLSEWFRDLSNVDGELLLNNLNKEVDIFDR